VHAFLFWVNFCFGFKGGVFFLINARGRGGGLGGKKGGGGGGGHFWKSEGGQTPRILIENSFHTLDSGSHFPLSCIRSPWLVDTASTAQVLDESRVFIEN